MCVVRPRKLVVLRESDHRLAGRTIGVEVVGDPSVAYDLRCDTCEFGRTVDEESDAYAHAKDHESDHPDHFVLIYAAE